MPEPIEYKVVRVLTRTDIPSPPTPGTDYRISDEKKIALGLSNGFLEEYAGNGGIIDYNTLSNKPTLNGVELSGNLTAAQLSLASEVVYEHTQSTPAITWNIQHNLGKKYVDILLLNDNDEEIVGEEDWSASTENLLVIHFSEALSGKAYIE
jgi:hypothetical protein